MSCEVKLFRETASRLQGNPAFNSIPNRLGPCVPIPFQAGSEGFLAQLCIKVFVGEQTVNAIGQPLLNLPAAP